MLISNIGMPSIGRFRETKLAVERFWKDKDAVRLEADLLKVRKNNFEMQKKAGVDLIPAFDQDPYDRLLRHAVMFSTVAKRFGAAKEASESYDTYFSIPRGTPSAVAGSMVKWFNTNYHCVRPEIESKFEVTKNFALEAYEESKSWGGKIKPAIIGPLTFCHFAVNRTGNDFNRVFDELSDKYAEIIKELSDAGADIIQIEEPALSLEDSLDKINNLSSFFQKLQKVKGRSTLILQTYFDSIDHIYPKLLNLPIDGIGMDFVSSAKNLDILFSAGFPEHWWLAAGIVDGRGVWISDYHSVLEKTEKLLETIKPDRLIIQPSCSLSHLPYTVEDETGLDNAIKEKIAFGLERFTELQIISWAILNGRESVSEELEMNRRIYEKVKKTGSTSVNKRLTNLTENDFSRGLTREKRFAKHQKQLNLPLFPTTTIGSFPQTTDMRKARIAVRKGEITKENYKKLIETKIKEWITIQEELDIDLLVHGEFERSDMVAYFAEQLEGISPIQGWVQSYGTRYVRPPLIFGDIEFKSPMTVEYTAYARELTDRPVKGIITGPVTILNWSFPRPDISRREQAMQIALALKEEVSALVKAGIQVIQIDEPALREGLPLKKSEWDNYLTWAVRAFRFVTGGLPDSIQIHTHMCFSEFSDIISYLNEMDADVLSVEDSKQGGRMARSLYTQDYKGAIGLGVYDVHSPRVPSVEEMIDVPLKALEAVTKENIWINPDCGLKTRTPEETLPQLKNMVSCAKKLRERYS